MNFKIVFGLLAVVLLCCLCGSAGAYYYTETVSGVEWVVITDVAAGHSGTANIPDDLHTILTGNLNGHIRLACDIDLSGYSWSPVGSAQNPFFGVFDGDGHVISNIIASFIYASNVAEIKCVHLKGDGVSRNIRNLIYGGRLTESIISDFNINFNQQGQFHLLNCNYVSDNIFDNNYVTGTTAVIFSGGSVETHNSLFKKINLVSNVVPSDSQVGMINGGNIYNVIAIDGIRNLAGNNENHHRLSRGASLISNSYASDTITNNRGYTWASNKNGPDGQTVTASQYNKKGFYDGTGIDGTVYLSWDFDNVWYWDETDNLPKLRVFNQGPKIVSFSLSPGQSSTIITGENIFVDVVLSGVAKTDEGNVIISAYNLESTYGNVPEFVYGYFSEMDDTGKFRLEIPVHPTKSGSSGFIFVSTADYELQADLIDYTLGMDRYYNSYRDYNLPYLYVRMVEPMVNLSWISQAKYHYPEDEFILYIESLAKYSGRYSWQYRQISPSIGPLSGVIYNLPEYQTSASELGLVPGNTYEFICSVKYSNSYTHQYTANQTVTVWEDPEPNTPGGPLVPVAVPYTATLTATSVNERMVSKYVWQQQIGGTWTDVFTGTQYEPSLSVPGAYPFRFVAYGKNEVNVTSPAITINGGFGPYAVITQPLNGAEILSGEIPLLGIVGGTDASYTWSFGNNVISHGTESGTVDAQQMNINSSVIYDDARPEKKTITLTVSNIYGNPAVYTIQILYGNTRITIRDPAHSEITPVDASGMYGLINDTKPQSEDNQMPDIGRMVSDIVKPFTNIMGEWFYLALFAIPYLIIFLRQKNILIPSIIGVLFAAWLLVFLPGVAMKAAIGIIVLCVAGGIFGLYAKR